MYNNEAILPHWTEQFIRLSEVLGEQNVFLSVFENGIIWATINSGTCLHNYLRPTGLLSEVNTL